MERGWLQAGVESSDQLGRVYSHCRPVGGLGASFPSIYDPDGGQLPSQPLLCVLGRQAGWLYRAGSPVGGDGFSQAIQVVEVVVCGEELAAGGTDRSCLQGPANHP